MSDIPKDKSYPPDSVQCDGCGGNGCRLCDDKGWLTPANHTNGRVCARHECSKPLPPDNYAVYCSTDCAFWDA